jgi:hypothetical protein
VWDQVILQTASTDPSSSVSEVKTEPICFLTLFML